VDGLLAVAFFGIGIAAAGALALWSWQESVPLPPMPRIAQEQFSKQSAVAAAKSDSPALPVAEPPPDQSPGGSERQSPTPELAGLNSAERDAVNSDSAIPPVVPSATDHATSTSRARWNERVSRRPEHTSRHARAVRVAAAKKPIFGRSMGVAERSGRLRSNPAPVAPDCLDLFMSVLARNTQ
jgi:hypothetical protein